MWPGVVSVSLLTQLFLSELQVCRSRTGVNCGQPRTLASWARIYPRQSCLCSHRAEECVRGCPIPFDRFTQVWRLTSRLILRKAGRLPIEKALHVDAAEEGGTADQSTRVNILTTLFTGGWTKHRGQYVDDTEEKQGGKTKFLGGKIWQEWN